MAITRAQQAKQMLQNGGMSLQDAKDMAPKGEFLAYINRKEADMLKKAGGSGAMTKAGIPSFDRGDRDDQMGMGGKQGTGGKGKSGSGGKGPSAREERMGLMGKTGRPDKSLDVGGPGVDRSKVSQFSQFGLNTMARNLGPPSLADKFGNITSNVRNFFSRFGPTTTANITDRFGYPTDVQGFGVRSSVGPTGPSRGDERGEIPLWMQLGYSSEAEYNAAMSGGATTPATTEEPPVDLNRIAYRLMADGGAVIDDEPRQAYGLGSIVKKAARAVKKVAKSDIGKAAIIAGLTFGIPGTSFGGLFGRASFGGAAKGLFGQYGIGATFGAAKAKLLGPASIDRLAFNASRTAGPSSIFSKIPGGKIGAGILAASALPLFMGGKEQEEEEELSPYVTEGLDIADIRSRPRFYQGQAYRLMAEGGDTEDAKEPVAKKVMPLIDMDGKEKDYRETGGFVDIGRMEKADDVPARLSKNEFVFTADAVRNAGDGSVDKGAEVMYNMMKNLEAGGEVSEESQGLEGARRMFKTSQRLEEVL